MIMMMKMH